MPKVKLSAYKKALQSAQQFVAEIRNLVRKPMWRYPKDKLEAQSWNLKDLWDRGVAAQACGHELVLRCDEEGIHVEYVKNVRLHQPPAIYHLL